MTPFERLQISPHEAEFNNRMSKVREAVEWGFGEAIRVFPFLNFSQNMRILLSPVGLYYLVAILLCNAHTILHSPLVPQYFTCPPPTLEEYLVGEPSEPPISSQELECISPWEAHDSPLEGEDEDENLD